MGIRDESYFLSPEYVQNSDMARALARLLSTADAQIGVNEIETSLLLSFVELERIIRSLGVTRERLLASGQWSDNDVRQQVLNNFRAHVGDGQTVSVYIADYIRYLAKWIE